MPNLQWKWHYYMQALSRYWLSGDPSSHEVLTVQWVRRTLVSQLQRHRRGLECPVSR